MHIASQFRYHHRDSVTADDGMDRKSRYLHLGDENQTQQAPRYVFQQILPVALVRDLHGPFESVDDYFRWMLDSRFSVVSKKQVSVRPTTS